MVSATLGSWAQQRKKIGMLLMMLHIMQ